MGNRWGRQRGQLTFGGGRQRGTAAGTTDFWRGTAAEKARREKTVMGGQWPEGKREGTSNVEGKTEGRGQEAGIRRQTCPLSPPAGLPGRSAGIGGGGGAAVAD